MIKQNFSLKMGVNLPKEGFSLDELVIETKRVFETEGMVGFLRVVIILLDHLVYPSLLGKWDKDVGIVKCCDHAHYVVSQSESKNIFTSVGKLQALWTRIRCAACGKSIIPLRGYLGLEPYKRKTSELEQIVTEVVSEQSYRRTSQHLQTIGSIPPADFMTNQGGLNLSVYGYRDYASLKARVSSKLMMQMPQGIHSGSKILLGPSRGIVREITLGSDLKLTDSWQVADFADSEGRQFSGIARKANGPLFRAITNLFQNNEFSSVSEAIRGVNSIADESKCTLLLGAKNLEVENAISTVIVEDDGPSE